MTTNLFVIANVKQLRTGGSFRILLPFFRTSCGVGAINSELFNRFQNQIEFGTILGVFRFSGAGFEPPSPPPSVRHWNRKQILKIWVTVPKILRFQSTIHFLLQNMTNKHSVSLSVSLPPSLSMHKGVSICPLIHTLTHIILHKPVTLKKQHPVAILQSAT